MRRNGLDAPCEDCSQIVPAQLGEVIRIGRRIAIVCPSCAGARRYVHEVQRRPRVKRRAYEVTE